MTVEARPWYTSAVPVRRQRLKLQKLALFSQNLFQMRGSILCSILFTLDDAFFEVLTFFKALKCLCEQFSNCFIIVHLPSSSLLVRWEMEKVLNEKVFSGHALQTSLRLCFH